MAFYNKLYVPSTTCCTTAVLMQVLNTETCLEKWLSCVNSFDIFLDNKLESSTYSNYTVNMDDRQSSFSSLCTQLFRSKIHDQQLSLQSKDLYQVTQCSNTDTKIWNKTINQLKITHCESLKTILREQKWSLSNGLQGQNISFLYWDLKIKTFWMAFFLSHMQSMAFQLLNINLITKFCKYNL